MPSSISQNATTTLPEHPTKKRKLDSTTGGNKEWDTGSFSTFNDISFSIPQRKKLKLEIGYSTEQGIRTVNGAGEVEFSIQWADIREIACLPVPEKAQASYNFCIFSNSHDNSAHDQMLWTVPDAVPKEGSFGAGTHAEPGETYKSTIVSTINSILKAYKKRVTEPSSSVFSSELAQAHRKGETAFHVKAFRGAKDGFMFLLSTGIVWGFKKPLQFFSFDVIDSVSYTSVLQRTFNLNIAVRRNAGSDTQEFEFSMIDQADFGGIDNYVKIHSLQDASMAEQRRAKKLNVNGVKAQDGDQADHDGEGELEKAAREAQDLDDDEEEGDENFDPGSEGESEGEGDSSGEEELGNGPVYGEDDMADGEPGSEADDDE